MLEEDHFMRGVLLDMLGGILLHDVAGGAEVDFWCAGGA
jgi:hypothetical protein